MIAEDKYLDIQTQASVLVITLNRPHKRNAIHDALLLELEQVLDQVNDEIKCMIICGSGQHFSAGLDLTELTERDVMQGLQHSRMWHRVLDKIQFGKVPAIAVLHGAVVGGGLELAAACHLRVAESSAFYALPEGQRGIYVGGGASVRLPKLIGIARMTDMMLTGRVFSSDEGEKIGMAQYLVAQGTGLDKAVELAQKIASNAGWTNFALTHVLPRIADAHHQEGLLMESMMAAIAQNAPEAKQRLSDFLEGKAKKVGES
jgi:enoyl-CoA hydratase/carnithine racemase